MESDVPLRVLVTVIFAFGTTAPLESVTVPIIDPYTAWADIGTGIHRRPSRHALIQVRTLQRFIVHSPGERRIRLNRDSFYQKKKTGVLSFLGKKQNARASD